MISSRQLGRSRTRIRLVIAGLVIFCMLVVVYTQHGKDSTLLKPLQNRRNFERFIRKYSDLLDTRCLSYFCFVGLVCIMILFICLSLCSLFPKSLELFATRLCKNLCYDVRHQTKVDRIWVMYNCALLCLLGLDRSKNLLFSMNLYLELMKFCRNFGPRVYPMGSMVIALVSRFVGPSVFTYL